MENTIEDYFWLIAFFLKTFEIDIKLQLIIYLTVFHQCSLLGIVDDYNLVIHRTSQ